MKSFPNILAVSLLLFAGAGPCLNHAAAQTNGASLQLSPAPAQAPPSDPRSPPQDRRQPEGIGFEFPGGTPLEFITAAGKQSKADWVSIATIPPEMANTLVPKLRVPVTTPLALLELYNRLGEQNPALGKWVWEGDTRAPTVLMLVPSGKTTTMTAAKLPEPPMQFKVFLLTYISGTNLNTVAEALKAISDIDQRDALAAGQTPSPSRVVIDQRTASLIVTGSREYMAMAEGVIMRMDIPSGPFDPPGHLTGHAAH